MTFGGFLIYCWWVIKKRISWDFDKLVALTTSFVSGALLSAVVISKVITRPLATEKRLFGELDKKGIRIHSMMIKTKTDCACATPEKLPELTQETNCHQGACH